MDGWIIRQEFLSNWIKHALRNLVIRERVAGERVIDHEALLIRLVLAGRPVSQQLGEIAIAHLIVRHLVKGIALLPLPETLEIGQEEQLVLAIE